MAKKKTTKLTNSILARYYTITEQIKQLKLEQDELKDLFKAVGSIETADYKMSVVPGLNRQMGSIAEVAKAFKVTEAKLDKLGLIRSTAYEQVRVTKKKEQ